MNNPARAPLGCSAYNVDGYLYCKIVDATWHPSEKPFRYCHCNSIKHHWSMECADMKEPYAVICKNSTVGAEDVMVKNSDISTHPHYHRNSKGKLVSCYHVCRSVLISPGFWFGSTCGFPIEHYLWEKVWPFTLITSWLGL
jgi:hypothetical protein